MLSDLINDIIEHEKKASPSSNMKDGCFRLANHNLDIIEHLKSILILTDVTIVDQPGEAYSLVCGKSPLFYGNPGDRYKVWIKGILTKDAQKMYLDKIELA